MRTVRAAAVGAEVTRRLARVAGSGRVHSAFARTINVTLDGLGDAGWLSLHGPGPLPASPSPSSMTLMVRAKAECTRPDPTARPSRRAASAPTAVA